MKKSIKYAGIAAATLLTVAPIAAPVLSTVSTTTVQADANNADQSDVNTAITDFTNQFGDQNAKDVTTLPATFGETGAMTLADFQKDNVTNGIISTDNTSKLAALENNGAQVYVTATDAKGNTYDGTLGNRPTDLANAMKLDSYLPVSVNVYYRYDALDGSGKTAWTKAKTFSLTKSDEDELTSLNAKFTTPLSVAKNSKVAATQLVNGANVTLTDQNGDSIATDSIVLGGTFYYTYAAALNGNATTGVVSNTDIKDGEFKTAGTYYQTVTYKAKSGSALDSMITEYNKDPSKYTILVNGKEASSSYDFTTSAGADTITFVRAVKVGDSEAEWTTEKTSGVVTTKSDADYYTLKNDDNASIKNRALAKNTAWKTNAVRTDQDGNKQYRVATGEWIDADSVTFGDSATTESGLTDIVKTKGVVTINKGDNYVFPLFDSNGDTIKGRAVSGNSAWQVAATAKDADGNVYYKVATNEWVMGGEGVTFA
ncbi:hypothetical protein [Companilactobacillus jidongensis]|uniref:hypothetical protein n=1 Tax=Companilactobacillus jidongensis TaxID=2486006 RepID=UPI000F79EDBE|nr:hypothetical protein [Companilactobacillus jidongensis]